VTPREIATARAAAIFNGSSGHSAIFDALQAAYEREIELWLALSDLADCDDGVPSAEEWERAIAALATDPRQAMLPGFSADRGRRP